MKGTQTARYAGAGSPAGSRRPISQRRALQVVKAVAEALNRAPTEGRAAEEALSRVADLLGIETGWVWLRDPTSDRFYSAAAQGLPPYLREPVRMTGRSCWCLDQFRSGRLTARNIDVLGCSRLAPAVRAGEVALTGGLRCHASVPLYAGDRPLGVMNLAMRGWRRLTRQELDLLTTIAAQLGVAVERARLAERSVERARAEERARIARDVHDTLAQGFTAIALHVEGALAALPRRDRTRSALERALEVAREGLDGARRSVGQLRASALGSRALDEAVRELARQFMADTGIRVRVEMGRVEPIRQEVEADLFRIATEALANVRKHARAHEVLLRLESARGRVRLAVQDDGVGFRVRGASRRGFGLAGIVDRALLAGGRATIRSAPGEGTAVVVTVPQTSAAEAR